MIHFSTLYPLIVEEQNTQILLGDYAVVPSVYFGNYVMIYLYISYYFLPTIGSFKLISIEIRCLLYEWDHVVYLMHAFLTKINFKTLQLSTPYCIQVLVNMSHIGKHFLPSAFIHKGAGEHVFT